MEQRLSNLTPKAYTDSADTNLQNQVNAKADLVNSVLKASQLPIATYNTPGGITVGTGLYVTAGVLSLPTAAFNVLGGIKPNGNFFINTNPSANGSFLWTMPIISELSGPTSTVPTAFGGIYAYKGELYLNQSQASGSITQTDFFASAKKIVFVPLATTTAPGKVQIGSGITVNSTGVISTILFTPNSIKSTLTATTSFPNGEFPGTQPSGSLPGMKCSDANYKYEYMLGMSDTDGTKFAWIRTPKI